MHLHYFMKQVAAILKTAEHLSQKMCLLPTEVQENMSTFMFLKVGLPTPPNFCLSMKSAHHLDLAWRSVCGVMDLLPPLVVSVVVAALTYLLGKYNKERITSWLCSFQESALLQPDF